MGADFAQNAALIAVALVAAIIGVLKYLKTPEGGKDHKSASTDATVLAASFLDSRLLRELIDQLRVGTDEYSRESRKLIRSRQDLITALEESTDAVLANTDASVNLLRFMRRQDMKDETAP